MTGVAINFSGLRGLSLDFTREVEQLGSSVQNAIVLLLRPRGVDKTSPDSGTDLMTQGSTGLMLSQTLAQHRFNFAAADVQAQVNTGAVEAADQLERLHLQVSIFQPPSIMLNIFASSNDGQVQGIDLFV